MPTIRGFVERLEIGRAGLVTASLSHDDGTQADYLISDLDADPERFNERLSKLGILRDAMTRAEPVEIEFDQGDNEGQLHPIHHRGEEGGGDCHNDGGEQRPSRCHHDPWTTVHLTLKPDRGE